MRGWRWFCVGLAALAGSAAAAASADSNTAPRVSLRDNGYLLGDLLEERVELPLPPGFTVDAASLPAPGRVAPWLEVRRSQWLPGSASGAGTIVVTYQIFAEVEQASRVPIPAFKVAIASGSDRRRIDVPEKSFLLSPALPPALTDEDRVLKSSPAPLPLPTGPVLASMFLSLLVALACVAYLLWANDRLPFLPRAPGPFARLWRRWRSRGRRELDLSDQQLLLREWHAALNEAAGETLYAATLPHLFERAPYLLPLRDRVEVLFRHSWKTFYGGAPVAEAATLEIVGLLREAALRERGAPC